MKRLFSYIVLLMIIMIPLKANALTGSIQVACSPSTINVNGSSTCNITGSSDGKVTSVDISVSVSDNLVIDSFTVNSNYFEGNDFNNNKIESYSKDANGITGNFTIGTIVVKAKSGATTGSESIKLSSITLYDENDKENTVSDVTQSISIAKVSTLSSLTVTGGTISTVGGFSPDVLDYVILLDSSTTSFSINATATESTDAITFYNESISDSNKIDGSNIAFKPDAGKPNMNILIKVGDTTYTLLIQKNVSATDNTLSTLTVGGVSVSLSSCKKEASDSMSCSVTIPASPVAYTVNATLTNSTNFKIDETDGGTGNYNSGPASFFIKVVPNDSSSGLTSLTYFVTVNRSGSVTTKPDISDNPQTGSVSSFIVAMILVASFVASIILYKRNIDGYQQ